jgi:exodeoxyribonuclease V alpha subunit
MISVSGSVDRIVFQNPESGFCVARFVLAEDGAVGEVSATIVGTLPDVREGETLRLDGEWQVHPVHGRNFRVERCEPTMPTSVEGMERYLASGAVSGIGPVTASRIVDHFGDRTIEVLDAEPELLRDVAGISAKRLEVIKESWSQQRKVREIALFLQDHGISVALAGPLHGKYGDDAIAIVTADPYKLARDIRGIGFRTADDIGKRIGISPRSLSRYVAGLRHVLSEGADEGHVFLPRTELFRRASRLLAAPIAELEPALLESLQHADTVLDSDRVYLAPFYRAEVGVAQMLRDLNSNPSSLTLDRRFKVEDAVAAAAEAQGLALAKKQIEAVQQALLRKVTILTGGPGTGKTSTLRTIISVLDGADISFCLCAPTGRAAKRVAETTGRPASTIHRLLEYQPGLEIYNYDRNRPLPFDFIIVDEVSMLDILLFYHLLQAVPPEAHILLVGDADQLPSVGAGSVLRDCIASEAISVVTLTELFRQSRDSQIILAAHQLIRGQVPEISNGPGHDLFFVRSDDEVGVVRAIKLLLLERIPRKFGLDPVEDVQIISPMHGGPAGVTSLNVEVQALLNPPQPGRPELRRGERTYRLADKVMQVRNNYEKDVYNGDVGRIAKVTPDEQALTITFSAPGGASIEVEYGPDELDELVLAYAVSVHKAQGNEFPCVIIPVVPRHSILLQRSLLYTAVTRARHLCVLAGSPKAFERAIARERSLRRNSHLGTRLAGYGDAPSGGLL